MAPWVMDPDSGGVKIPEATKERTRRRILEYAEEHYAGRYTRLDIRFRGVFCYIDAYKEPEVMPNWPPADWGVSPEEYYEGLRNTPIHLCRLRHFAADRWSLAFFTYSNETYKLAVFPDGDFFGTPEEGFEVGAIHLQA